MSETEDKLKHELGNVEAKAVGLERLLKRAADHIRVLTDPVRGDNHRAEARRFLEQIQTLDGGGSRSGANRAAAGDGDVKGKHILVVEDQVYHGMSLKVLLLDAGAAQVRVCDGLAACRSIIKSDFRPDAAVLDLDIAGKDVRPMAHDLVDMEVPFIFHTASVNPDELQADFPHHIILTKPAEPDAVVGALNRAISGRGPSGEVTPAGDH
ncbi:MAG: hypothetical protein WA906_11275 [Pacificimonas sp.]